MIEHGGNLERLAQMAGCAPEELLDFSVNLHPDGIPEGVFGACFQAMNQLSPYPETHAASLSVAAGAKWHLPPENILFGNGSSELLQLLPSISGAKRAVVVTPGYLEYEQVCAHANLAISRFALSEAADFQLDLPRLKKHLRPGDLVLLGNPNNPTGCQTPAEELYSFLLDCPEQLFLIDEAFADFSGETLLARPLLPHVGILRSMTKYHAIAGLRLGYLVANADIIVRMRDMQTPWSVGVVAARVAEQLLSSPERADTTGALRQQLSGQLQELGIKVFSSRSNYLLLKTARPLFRELLRQKIAVRDCSNYPGLDTHFIRVAVRCEADNLKLVNAFRTILAPGLPHLRHPRKKPALMLQGTCSNAGKSILAAAFCRILLQDGYTVAPFKAQNMALNSAVTPDGGEIGRAQAVQAEACRMDPDVRMNPILLKPNSDLGSQVVVLGQPIGNFKVRDYFAKKQELWHIVREAYDSLASSCDCMVLEGAGSPGEINLKNTDLVNMRMAQYAQARVLLAGDIDRGGVYASFIGTYATFEPWERELLHGFLVNKFRGDPTLLEDAHTYIRNMTGKPVLGVIDHLKDLKLPEEDSVSFGFAPRVEKHANGLDIAIIHLGHIANYTDFAPFEIEPDTAIRIVREARELGRPDLIVIPGSKGVAEDIGQLRQSGLFEAIAQSEAFLAGICGGLQILGRRLLDPEQIESTHGEVAGLDLLPLETVMQRRKILRQTRATLSDGCELQGYEIHHGVTTRLDGNLSAFHDHDGREIGYGTERIFATYLHGVFDNDRFRRAFLNRIRRRKGWANIATVAAYGFEPELNRLADHVRERVELKKLYRELGL